MALTYYKMQASCSTASSGFISWVNTTGDDTNRPVCAGTLGPTTMVDSWPGNPAIVGTEGGALYNDDGGIGVDEYLVRNPITGGANWNIASGSYLSFGPLPNTVEGDIRFTATLTKTLISAKYVNGGGDIFNVKVLQFDGDATQRFGDPILNTNVQGNGLVLVGVYNPLLLYGQSVLGMNVTSTNVETVLPSGGYSTAGDPFQLKTDTIALTGLSIALTNAQKSCTALRFTGDASAGLSFTMPDKAGGRYQITNDASAPLTFTDGGAGTAAVVYPGQKVDIQHINGQYAVLNQQSLSDWTTLLDLDFSTEPNQTLTTDGAYAIGGRSWTKFNSANDQVAMAIVNGSGLVIQPKSTSDYNGANRTFPGIELALSNIPGIAFATGCKVRVTVYIGAQNITNNYDGVIFGIDSQTNVCGYVVKYGKVSSTTGTTCFIQAASSNAGFVDSTVTLGATSNCVRLIIPNYGMPSLGVGYAAGTGNTIPAANAFNPTRSQQSYAPSSTDMSGLTLSNMAVILGGQRAGSVTALSLTVSRIVVECQL